MRVCVSDCNEKNFNSFKPLRNMRLRYLRYLFFALTIVGFVIAVINYTNTHQTLRKMQTNVAPTTFRLQLSMIGSNHHFKYNPEKRIFEKKGKPILWQFWDSKNVPVYVALMLEAMKCRNPELELILVHASTMYDYLPQLELDIPKEMFGRLTGVHQADLFRIAVLRQYGGMYLDVDVYPLDKIYPLFEMLDVRGVPNYDALIPMRTRREFGQIGMITRANVSFFNSWYSNQISRIKDRMSKVSTIYPIPWGYILMDAAENLYQTIKSKRSNIFGYYTAITTGQLVSQGLVHSATLLWEEESKKFLPLSWAPYIYVHGTEMREALHNITSIHHLLLPENATVYSAFVSCGLLDCLPRLKRLEKENVLETAYGKLNIAQLLETLQKIDPILCESIRKVPMIDAKRHLRKMMR